MLLVDDALSFPIRGVFWIFKEIHSAAMDELANEAESAAAELRELYMNLERGGITEEEFAAREKILLDRLEKSQGSENGDEEEGENEDST